MATPLQLGAKAQALRLVNQTKGGLDLQQPLIVSEPETSRDALIDVGDESDDFKDNNLVVSILDTALVSAGRLANLLPTATFLLFQILVPIFSNSGDCSSDVDIGLTIGLLVFCGLACLITTFTDSFTTKGGNVHYGIVLWFGLWTPQLDKNYAVGGDFKWRWSDFFHGALAVIIFYTSTLFTSPVRYCFYPDLVDRTANLVCNIVPPLSGFIISILFILFPTQRRGVGYPITAALLASVGIEEEDEPAVEVPGEAAAEALPPSVAPAEATPPAAAQAAPAAAEASQAQNP